MTADPTMHDAFDISFDARFRLEELVDKKALAELGRNVFALFGIPLRIFNADNALVAEAGAEHELCAAINTEPAGRKACGAMVDSVRSCDPDKPDLEMPCFSGLSYRVFTLDYEGRRVGKLVLGPFALPQTQDAPESLTQVVTGQDKKHLTVLVAKVPHAKSDTLTRIATHIKATLDLILFSGHKALVTSTMHLATVTDNYRQLEEKNRNLQLVYDRLKELDRLKSNFLGTVSHELRTPLTSIIGYSEMLAEGITGELNPEQKEFVTTIHSCCSSSRACSTSPSWRVAPWPCGASCRRFIRCSPMSSPPVCPTRSKRASSSCLTSTRRAASSAPTPSGYGRSSSTSSITPSSSPPKTAP
jgi:hypothetical protein